MSLAYVILAHKLPQQLARLVSVLYQDDDLFLIHVDAKSDPAPFMAAVRERQGAAANIQIVEPVRCDWGGFGLVRATLNAVDQALRTEHGFTHLVLLSGQDYPIKPVASIRRYFAEHAGRSFMSWSAGDDPWPMPPGYRAGNQRWYWAGELDRLTRWHFIVRGRLRSFPNRYVRFSIRRRIPPQLQPFQGSSFWSLSADAVRYVRDVVAADPQLVRFFRRVFIPDEFIFQMILLNSPLRESVENEDLRYMTWVGWHPPIIRSSELAELANSSKFFARKFDVTVDGEVLDLIDSTLL